MIKILIIGLLFGIFTVGVILMATFENQVEENTYSGPVPEGYDEEHFRLTGETKLNGDINGE